MELNDIPVNIILIQKLLFVGTGRMIKGKVEKMWGGGVEIGSD